jgi:hypothetical protein
MLSISCGIKNDPVLLPLRNEVVSKGPTYGNQLKIPKLVRMEPAIIATSPIMTGHAKLLMRSERKYWTEINPIEATQMREINLKSFPHSIKLS